LTTDSKQLFIEAVDVSAEASMRMGFSELLQKPLASVALTIVFGRPVLFLYRLRKNRYHFLTIRMHNGSS